MKTSPVYTALESIAYNINRKSPNLKFFEFGRSYEKKQDEDSKKLNGYPSTLQEIHQKAIGWKKVEKSTFHDLSNTVQSMFKYAGIKILSLNRNESSQAFFI